MTRNIINVCLAVAMVAMTLGASVTLKAQSAIGTVATLTGFVLDAATLLPVESNYAVYDESGKKIGQSRRASAADGFLVTGLQPGATYTLRVEDPRYFKQEFSVTVPKSNKYSEISKDLIVRKLEAGRRILVNPSPFDLRKTDIREGMEEDLRDLAKTLSMNPSVKLEIVCYPDEDVTASKAASISEERGKALKAFLEQAGVNASRITVKTVQTTDPINPPPLKKGAKGKRYTGSVYLQVSGV
jgi:outer membrane protein OmpA-like peptidoglycan-associated protein